MKTHIYIVNTPFQAMIVDTIVNTLFALDRNIVYTTLVEANIKNAEVRKCRRNLLSIIDCFYFKREIKKEHQQCQLDFFLPHVNNLLSAFCYNFALENQNKLNVYYEGIALFYDPIVYISKKDFFLRKIVGFLSTIGYDYNSKLFPTELRDVATTYSPLPSFTHFRKVVKFRFSTKEIDIYDSILLIGTRLCYKDELDNLFTKMELLLVMESNIDTIHFKPHFKSNKKFIDLFVLNYKTRIKLIVINKDMPIESLSLYSKVYSIQFSSALINLKLINANVDIEILSNVSDDLIEITKELDIKILI